MDLAATINCANLRHVWHGWRSSVENWHSSREKLASFPLAIGIVDLYDLIEGRRAIRV